MGLELDGTEWVGGQRTDKAGFSSRSTSDASKWPAGPRARVGGRRAAEPGQGRVADSRVWLRPFLCWWRNPVP